MKRMKHDWQHTDMQMSALYPANLQVLLYIRARIKLIERSRCITRTHNIDSIRTPAKINTKRPCKCF